MQKDTKLLQLVDNHIQEEIYSESVNTLLNRLSNVEYVLENAALTAALMNYLHNAAENYNSLLFYYIIRRYEKINEILNAVKNYHYIHMEIFTVFVHPKAVLYVEIKDLNLLNELTETINAASYTTVFDKVGKYIVETYITPFIENFKQSVVLGLETFSFEMKIHHNLDRQSELEILESFQETLVNSLIRSQKVRCIHQNSDKKNAGINQDFQIAATLQSLSTQYEYFLKSKKYSYLSKSPQKLKSEKTFISLPVIYNAKKTKIKGHNFLDYVPSNATECIICENILWGSFPQGLYCKICQLSIHRDCKQYLKVCEGGGKQDMKKMKKVKSEMNSSKESQEFVNEESPKLSPSPSTVESPKYTNSNNETGNTVTKVYQQYSEAVTELQNKWLQSNSHYANLQEIKKTNIKSTKSLNLIDYTKTESDIFRSKSARNHSPEALLCDSPKSIYDVPRIPLLSPEPGLSEVTCNSPIKWDSDEEMQVTKTFDPKIELKRFPNHERKMFSRRREHSRLLVLLEFHHKIKFIRMTLKKFKYLLVDKWLMMGEHLDLFDSLSLGCIEKLYLLIKSLVETMDRCQQVDTYDENVAKCIYSWLTKDEDKNFNCWLRLAVDLCCTNVLNPIKASYNEQKRLYPKLSEILSIKLNRILVIEQIAQMKPILFDLPLIVAKIVKDLKRYPQYSDEAEIWEEIHQKLKYLPKFIDERCMPVVELINNGTVISSSLKFIKAIKEGENSDKLEKYVTNFPKTIFQDDFIDFQLVMISNLRESQKDDTKIMQPSVYTREEIEAAAICYDNKIIILQKENDKYLLKKFKSVNQKHLVPMISFDQVHVTKQTVKEVKHHSFELTILLIDQAILVQILFKEQSARDMWFNHVSKKSKRSDRINPLKYSASSSTVVNSSTSNSEEKDKLTSTFTSLINHLHDISDILNDSFQIIFKGPLENCDPSAKLETIVSCGPDSSNEFVLAYFQFLQNFTNLGIQMIEENVKTEPSQFMSLKVAATCSRRIKDLSPQINHLVEFEKLETKYIIAKKTYNSIEEYIEEVIVHAKEKIVMESKYNADIYK